MRQINSQCLVLNADYSPLGIISWKRAIIWSCKHQLNSKFGVDIIDFYKNDYIQGTNNKKIPIPAVVKTVKYFKINYQSVNFSRKNLFIRDSYSCQYCGLQKDIAELTYDHVIPKSVWKNKNSSPTCWTNIVTACVACNRKKGNRTPLQANMPLRNLPIIPNRSLKYLPVSNLLLKIRSDIPEEWSVYLPESYYNA
jgi:5-methylcytosine-specific restriction endonuclease McrA